MAIGADGRDVHEMEHAGLARRLGDGARAIDVDGAERLLAAGSQHADGVDDELGADHGPLHRLRVAQVGLNGCHLADETCRLQEAGEIRAAHGGAHAPALFGQRRHGIAADKTRSAENRRNPLVVETIRHRRFLLGQTPARALSTSGIHEAPPDVGRMRAAARDIIDKGRGAL